MNSKCVSIWCAIVCAAGSVLAQSNTCSVSCGGSLLTSALLKSLIAGADPGVRPSADCGGPTVISGGASLLSFYKDVSREAQSSIAFQFQFHSISSLR